MTAKYDKLGDYVKSLVGTATNFNVGIGQTLLSLADKDYDLFASRINDLRKATAQSLTTTNTTTLQECHELMLQMHVLGELEAVGNACLNENVDRLVILRSFNQRLDIVGPFLSHKQYILGLRRAAMQLSRYVI